MKAFDTLRMSKDILRQGHNFKAILYAILGFILGMILGFGPLVWGVALLIQGKVLAAILTPLLLYLFMGILELPRFRGG